MSSAANDAVMVDAIKLVHEGVTEREIADQMLGLYRKHDCEGLLVFPPIVSFGATPAIRITSPTTPYSSVATWCCSTLADAAATTART